MSINNKYEKIVRQILGLTDVKINGSNPWDIQVHNDLFYQRIVTGGALGLGESYMEGLWDTEALDELIFKILRSKINTKIKKNFGLLLKLLQAKIFNLQTKSRSFIIGKRHYDLGNELFQIMLDKLMNYSCGYWKDAQNLDDAQKNKLELICQKLNLESGMRVLDIGCGWGSFGRYAAAKYNIEVVGITVSKEQVELGRKLCEGLPVDFRLMDYRDIKGEFDRIVSVGMIEHVGYKNYKTFFEVANKCLKEDGLFLLHTIGNNISSNSINRWSNKYIFPNAVLPSVAQIGKSIEKLFVMEDWHNFGTDYDKTLMAWYKNFNENWFKIKDKYSTTFYRMWKYYLMSCAGSFRARDIQVWQIVLSKNGLLTGYKSFR